MSIHFKTTLDLIYVHNQSILCNFQLKNKVHRPIWVNLKTILRPLLSTFMSLFNRPIYVHLWSIYDTNKVRNLKWNFLVYFNYLV